MPESDTQKEKKQLFDFISKVAFFKEKIILSSGKESDYYIDARRATLASEGAYLCGRIFIDMLKKETFDAVGGPTMGADPIVGAIAALSFEQDLEWKTFIVRKEPKGHGRRLQTEGPPLDEGARVILIDDVATTGKAFLMAIDALERQGIKSPKAYCIVDRGEGAKEALAARGCELVSIFRAEEFLK